ncbi:MAG: GntR family transcriptional regulator [Candidatus Nanopelagicales bacterium]
MFNEVAPQRTADAVFDQVRDQIVGGALVAGEALPGERELAAQLGVSRGVVREALQRLSQAGLIDIRHGGATRIRDFLTSTDLNLLQRLMVQSDGSVNARVLRSLLEMRISIGVDAARLAALRADVAAQTALGDLVDRLAASDDILERQDIDLDFWSKVVESSGNVAYRIAYNGLAATYRPLRAVIVAVVEPELDNLKDHRKMVKAIARGDSAAAERAARSLLECSENEWAELLTALTTEEGNES